MIRFDRSALRRGFGRTLMLDALEAGAVAIDPRRAVSTHLALDGMQLRIGRDSIDVRGRRVWAIAIGKAAVPMAEAVSERLGDDLAGGIALTRHGYGGDVRRVEVHEAGHPIPDEHGLRAATAIGELADRMGADELILCLLSGGGSALLTAPPNGVSLDDLAATTRLCLGSGATIDEINTVRRHLSTLQGGRLACRLHPSQVVTLALSDVLGDRLEAIASGPTVPDPTTTDEAIAVLRWHHLWDRLPSSVRGHLESGVDAESPKAGDPMLQGAAGEVIGNNETLLDAIERAGRDAGCRTVRAAKPVTGEARDAGRALGRRAVELARGDASRTLWISGGETTVTVTGGGRGGRNQELALAAALEIAGVEGICIAAFASDGSDGVTDAAGAIVDRSTAERIERAGIDPRAALDDNDAHAALSAAGDVLHTGPTRTNVADAYVAFIDAA